MVIRAAPTGSPVRSSITCPVTRPMLVVGRATISISAVASEALPERSRARAFTGSDVPTGSSGTTKSVVHGAAVASPIARPNVEKVTSATPPGSVTTASRRTVAPDEAVAGAVSDTTGAVVSASAET